jgi:hypothetical protein
MSHCDKIVKMLGMALVATTFLSGCSTISKVTDDLFGRTRTLPDDAKVDFGNRHSPVMNPGSSQNVPLGDSSSLENNSSSNVVSSGRKVPVENNNLSANAPAPTVMSAPVAPVTAAAPTAPNNIVQAPINTMAAKDEFPALASVPPAPKLPPKENNTKDFNSLAADREISESARKELMNNQAATVMTSPQTGQLVDNAAEAQAPQAPSLTPPVLVASTPQPAPTLASAPQPTPAAHSDTGFNHWLHNLFVSDKTKTPTQIAKPADNVLPAPTPMVVAEAPASQQPIAAQPASAPFPEIPHEEVVYDNQPTAPLPAGAPVAMAQPVVNPAPVVSAPAMPAAPPPVAAEIPAPTPVLAVPPPSQAELEPVHLHPPTSSADSSVSAADTAQMADQSADQPIKLVAPKTSGGVSQARYLADSRYASRRTRTDDSSN